MQNRVYFDHNATTRPHPELKDLVPQWIEAWGNPSSVHKNGREPKQLLRESRKKIAAMIGASPLEIVFTSSGSESINQIVKGVYFRNLKEGLSRNHYLVSAVEHPATLKSFEFIKSLGAEVELIEVDRDGQIDIDKFKKQVRSDTGLISMMFANNETGSIYPIKEMAAIAHERGALFHADCVQGLGKAVLSVEDLGVDFASFSSHKVYALRGAGITFIRTGVQIESLIHGGGQERHRRAGTENLLAIASLAYIAEKMEALPSVLEKVSSLRDSLECYLKEIDGVHVTAQTSTRLGNTSNFIVQGVDGETLLMNLDINGISISTGAACSSGSQEPSPTLRAMGLSRQEATSSMRVSLGWFSTQGEVDKFGACLKECVERIRSLDDLDSVSDGVR